MRKKLPNNSVTLYEKKMHLYDWIVPFIVLAEGDERNSGRWTQKECLHQMWKWTYPPPVLHPSRKVNRLRYHPEMKWYIRNYFSYDWEGWNADYLFGLMQNGKIKWSVRNFPNWVWQGNPD